MGPSLSTSPATAASRPSSLGHLPPWCWSSAPLLAALAGPVLFVAAAVVALVLAVVAYLYAGRVVLGLSHARPVSLDEEPRYHNLVEGLCVSAGLPKPELYVIDDDAPNSFATGRNPDHAAIVVTTGLLEKLSRMELEGVLAHELAHIRSHDTLVTGLGAALVALPLHAGRAAVRPPAGRPGRAGPGARRRHQRRPPHPLPAGSGRRPGEAPPRRGRRRLSASRATAHLWISSPLDGDGGAGGSTSASPPCGICRPGLRTEASGAICQTAISPL